MLTKNLNYDNTCYYHIGLLFQPNTLGHQSSLSNPNHSSIKTTLNACLVTARWRFAFLLVCVLCDYR